MSANLGKKGGGGKQAKTAKFTVVVENTVSFGIKLIDYTMPNTTQIYPVWCDDHQRKHSNGPWPGSTPSDKPLFKAGIYDSGHLALPMLVANAIPWDKVKPKIGGTDIVLYCSKAVGTEGETEILVQGGFQKDKFTFHCYPVEKDAKRKGAYTRSQNDYGIINLNVDTIV